MLADFRSTIFEISRLICKILGVQIEVTVLILWKCPNVYLQLKMYSRKKTQFYYLTKLTLST